MSGPITSRCLPPDVSAEFSVVTRDLDGSEPIVVVSTADFLRAANNFNYEAARLTKLFRRGEIEPARVQLFESGELTQEYLIA